MNGAVRIFDDPLSLAQAFAGELAASIGAAPAYSIALSGGNTPRLLFETLALRAAGIDWQGVHFFWGDERCVPPDDKDSNYRMAREALFDNVGIPALNIHRIMGENDPRLEAERYSDEMLSTLPLFSSTPRLDFVMLGLGDDGHTASIFPHNIDLIKSERLCEVSAHPKSGQKRITVTGRVLAQAARLAFIVTGAPKARMIAEILGRKDGYEAYPAGLLHAMRDDAQWWLDGEAAAMLEDLSVQI